MALPTVSMMIVFAGAALGIVARFCVAIAGPVRTVAFPAGVRTIDLLLRGAGQLPGPGSSLRHWLREASPPRHLVVDASNGAFCGQGAPRGSALLHILTPRIDISAALRKDPAEAVQLIRALVAPHAGSYGRITLVVADACVLPTQLDAMRPELVFDIPTHLAPLVAH